MEELKYTEDGKISVPGELQQKFYEIADQRMEQFLSAGLLTNRFTLRAFAVEMMCAGYYFDKIKK